MPTHSAQTVLTPYPSTLWLDASESGDVFKQPDCNRATPTLPFPQRLGLEIEKGSFCVFACDCGRCRATRCAFAVLPRYYGIFVFRPR